MFIHVGFPFAAILYCLLKLYNKDRVISYILQIFIVKVNLFVRGSPNVCHKLGCKMGFTFFLNPFKRGF